MLQLVATAAIVLMVAALSVYAPMARPPKPAHLAPPEPEPPIPLPELGRDPLSRLVGVLRTRRWARMALTTLSVGLLVGAVATVGYPFYTNLLQDRLQSRLDRQIASPELRQAYLDRNVAVGDSLTRIVIPDIDVDVVVVEGTTASALRAGAGHYPNTPLPCEIGNVGIAGHRTTYGRPFHNLDLLKPGSEITLQTPIGSCTYQVTQEPFPVSPNQTEVVANTPDEATLTLTTCHPKGSARQRLIVKATLVRSELEGQPA
ncbi:MAG TPA: class E sortase [Acidimicrobiales bacterium]|nr:class E sortase [Acidimicrobiales bacterium]